MWRTRSKTSNPNARRYRQANPPRMPDGTARAAVPNELQGRCPVIAKLLKTLMRGGILTLTHREVVLGEGLLGTQNVRRFPLQSLAHLDLLPSPGDKVLRQNMLLRFVWDDGQTTEVDGIGLIAAQRIHDILQALCGPSIRR